MLPGSDPLEELAIPDETTVEEHDLVTDRDVLIGGQSTIEFGIRGGDVFAGERVHFGGGIEAAGDCRLDMWCDVAENVLVGEDAYLGERVHVGGRLLVSGDLDIGDDVTIEEGFEANGWIVIRNPMPTIVFLFIYLGQLLRIGEEEAARSLIDEYLGEDSGEDDTSPLVIPRSASVSDDAWRVSTSASVGDDCRLHGNLRATAIEVGDETEIFGSLRSQDDVSIGTASTIHGDVRTRNGSIDIGPDTTIMGDLSCETLEMAKSATVEGSIRARDEISLQEPTPDPA